LPHWLPAICFQVSESAIVKQNARYSAQTISHSDDWWGSQIWLWSKWPKRKKNQKTIHYYFLRDGSELGRARGSQNGEKKEGIMWIFWQLLPFVVADNLLFFISYYGAASKQFARIGWKGAANLSNGKYATIPKSWLASIHELVPHRKIKMHLTCCISHSFNFQNFMKKKSCYRPFQRRTG
jgi:hypothetical protein